jgi:acylglycerol lipase
VLRSQSTFHGLLIVSPALDVEWTPVLRVQAAIGGLLSSLLPKAKLVPAVKVCDLSQDQAVCDAFEADPLNTLGNVRCRMGNESLGAMRSLAARYPDFTLPIWGTQGDTDRITSLPAHQRFMDAVSSKVRCPALPCCTRARSLHH